MTDEGVLDPAVVAWFDENPMFGQPLEDFSPEILELARSEGGPPAIDIAKVTDDVVDGIRIRCYEHDEPGPGLLVYFHGGGHCIGSIGIMDNVARELATCAGVPVVSVEYRLAPEHPFPEGLDDCEAVTRWALANAASRFGVPSDAVIVGGESAGGNLAAAVSLRLRNRTDVPLRGQLLLYPGTDGNSPEHKSRQELVGVVLSRATMDGFWQRYSGGRDLSRDPFVCPLRAETLAGLPPAMVMLGGADPLRDEGRGVRAAPGRRRRRGGGSVLRRAAARVPELRDADRTRRLRLDWGLAGEDARLTPVLAQAHDGGGSPRGGVTVRAGRGDANVRSRSAARLDRATADRENPILIFGD